jgi:hypothetical protein
MYIIMMMTMTAMIIKTYGRSKLRLPTQDSTKMNTIIAPIFIATTREERYSVAWFIF